ncbi:outer membrane protein assembly factor BamE [Candidatus Magnetaquicoccus inordinatus]|uniref:outer membrane protein assembly factor BamE n=1 Tax=Candidatus Magnetaquicoccus inordinatus TaxID=2496818 RepID=UPI00102C86D7|nr:outer membrane protein assembly factor BamE [Candidatus Magnetaquicoccus inordinatus]
MVKWPRSLFWLFLASLLSLLSACQARIQEKGTIISPQAVERIQVGRTTRAQVKELLGFPTVINTVRRDRWIYIQDRQYRNIQRTFARVINRVEITFDERGIVRDLRHNFADELLDPEKIPEAQNTQLWFAWLWDGEYARPATGSGNKVLPATEIPAHALDATPKSNPWWKFWSADKE